MGTTTARKRKDRTIAHLAQLLIKRVPFFTRRPEHSTGSRRQRPDRRDRKRSWRHRGHAIRKRVSTPVLSNVIERYVSESKKEIGGTKAQVLNAIKGYEIAERRCSTIGSADLVEFANQLAAKVKPSTARPSRRAAESIAPGIELRVRSNPEALPTLPTFGGVGDVLAFGFVSGRSAVQRIPTLAERVEDGGT